MTTIRQTIQLHKAQADFHHSPALYRGYVGGRGAGKSWIGAYDLLRRAKANRLYAVYAPTYPMLKDSSFRTFQMLGRQLMFIKDVNRSSLQAVLGNGAEVLFRSMDDPERARGPNLSGVWMDESSIMPRGAYEIAIASLREAGEAGWLSATFTPKGRGHWTYDVFGQGKPDTALFQSRTKDNPFLPDSFYETVKAQYAGQFAAQELEGQFVDLEGSIARREWFPIVDAAPAQGQRCRYWDFAATERSAKSDNPDYTVGTRMVADSAGMYYVEHVIRGRYGPGAVERLVLQTAASDGKACRVAFEQEGGSSGKLFGANVVKMLAGYTVTGIPSTGDKVTRAMPFIAQAEAGNVRLVNGPWVTDWLDEIVSVPLGAHDDQWDSAAGAFSVLAQPRGILLR